jgi:hypothetical protein
MLPDGILTATLLDERNGVAKLLHERPIVVSVLAKGRGVEIDLGGEWAHLRSLRAPAGIGSAMKVI